MRYREIVPSSEFVIPADLTKLNIVYYPDPMLKRMCSPVTDFTTALQELAQRMLEIMREANGVGLAAPQVGIPIRLFVCNPSGEPGEELIVVNPQLTDLEEYEDGDEGCLSMPGVTVKMRRAVRVTLTGRRPDGEQFVARGEGFPARVWQHERDHLDGKLIIDNMSSTDEIANRRAIRQLESAYR